VPHAHRETVQGDEGPELRRYAGVTADDLAFEADVKAWCAKMKAPLNSLTKRGAAFVAVIQKG
jgi:hypothetical protein